MSWGLSMCAYWTGRKEPATTCADRIVHFREDLAAIDPVFDRWYEPSHSRSAALKKPLPPAPAAVAAALTTSGLAAKSPRMPQLGFSFSAWNGGEDGHDASLRVVCGNFSTVPNAPRNLVVMHLPREEPEATRVAAPATLHALLRACVNAFDPDSAVVQPDGAPMLQFGGRMIRTLGLLTYFRVQPFRLTTILPDLKIVALNEGAVVDLDLDPRAWNEAAKGKAVAAAERLGREGIFI